MAVALVFVISTLGHAQAAPEPKAVGPDTGFEMEHWYLDAHEWVGGTRSATVGATIEYALGPKGRYVPGFLGLVGAADRSTTQTSITASAVSHFRFDEKRVDPFVGLGLRGYVRDEYGAGPHGLSILIDAGLRYYITPRAAAMIRLGGGLGDIAGGLTWKY